MTQVGEVQEWCRCFSILGIVAFFVGFCRSQPTSSLLFLGVSDLILHFNYLNSSQAWSQGWTFVRRRKRDELVRMAADIFVQTGKQAGSELSKAEFDQLVTTEAGRRVGCRGALGESEVYTVFLAKPQKGPIPQGFLSGNLGDPNGS